MGGGGHSGPHRLGVDVGDEGGVCHIGAGVRPMAQQAVLIGAPRQDLVAVRDGQAVQPACAATTPQPPPLSDALPSTV